MNSGVYSNLATNMSHRTTEQSCGERKYNGIHVVILEETRISMYVEGSESEKFSYYIGRKCEPISSAPSGAFFYFCDALVILFFV